LLERFDREERWTGVLAQTLGAGWKIVEEGLPARTTVHDDPIEGRHKNGLSYLRPCLESHLPVDVVVLMLGPNDLKARFSSSPPVALNRRFCLQRGPSFLRSRLTRCTPIHTPYSSRCCCRRSGPKLSRGSLMGRGHSASRRGSWCVLLDGPRYQQLRHSS